MAAKRIMPGWKKKLKNFLKYNTFHKEQHPPRKPELVEKAASFLSTSHTTLPGMNSLVPLDTL
jgi:hypothetical protein